jgi:2-succinyl-6-hydroxy-2,4-cyclohexadiene-1-carboxylate synthase
VGVIWCLHGFLGRGADWDFLRHAGFDIRAPSLFGGDSLDDLHPAADDILLGYSMGARLALHLLQTHPVAGAVLVSTGVDIPAVGRRELDQTWALRFESEPWQSVVEAWNAQPVFGGRANPLVRNESDYDRHALAAALRQWSPAVLRMSLHGVAVPTLWIAGEEDAKYAAAARRAAEQLPGAQLWICPGAGHRVPWEQPERFIERLRAFLVSPRA